NIKPFLPVVLFSLFLHAPFSQAAPAGEGGMSEEQMQQMMEQMQKMQACMAGIDQSDMDRLSARAEEAGREIEAL
ncbi:MAG: hypothetical protein GWO23_10155, partial [Gammaproteobacteria bacterium]|nr:hypothetical protein [Gammaproteobacteria bacterium]